MIRGFTHIAAIAFTAGGFAAFLPVVTWADERPEVEWAFELTYEADRRRGLEADRGDHLSKLTPELKMELEHEIADDITGYVELEFAHDRILHHGWQRDEDHETTLDLKQLYIEFGNIGPGLALMVGRQDFQDARKWYFDEELDGLRLTYQRDKLSLEAAATRELLFRKNLLESHPDEDAINNYVIKVGYEVRDSHHVSAYTLIRDGMAGVDEELIYYGLSAQGEFSEGLTYWGELAYLRGRDGDDSLNGLGFDLGATWRFDTAYQPSLTLAYAEGSGGDDGKRFRQSGLEGNEARFNGVEDFLYYGEALNPELSNIRILTAGFGIRPTENSSIDLVAHRYWQDVATDGRLPGAAMIADANGDSRDIGTGIDLIFGYREIEDIALGLRLGWFKPGNAFDGDRTMFTIQAGLDYDF